MTVQLKKVSDGWYETSYLGHSIELMNLKKVHQDPHSCWIAPVDGSNDIEPRDTRADALAAAMIYIESLGEPK
jgi:hypothetical protein